MKKKYHWWREILIEPQNIQFTKIKFKKIKDLLPAGNDVMECIVECDKEEKEVYIKIERSKMACFSAEIENISKLYNTQWRIKVPKIIEYGYVNDKQYIVTEKVKGTKLSKIFEKNISNKEKYLYKYGKELANIHKISPQNFNDSKQRIINDYPRNEDYKEIDQFIEKYILYLKRNKPETNFETFIHGDFHYANILWEKEQVSAILDFEYSGKGFKEQDIAWALILRPGQQFMDNIVDINAFLQGYKEVGNYDFEKLKWCVINGCCHFYLMNLQDSTYISKLKNIIELFYYMITE